MMEKILGYSGLLLLSIGSFAQSSQDSTIEEKVFTISEYYQYSPAELEKRPFYATMDKDTFTAQNSVSFSLESQSLFYPYMPLGTKPLAYHEIRDEQKFQNYVRGGYGSRQAGLLQAGLILNPDKPWRIDLDASHIRGQNYEQMRMDVAGGLSHNFVLADSSFLVGQADIHYVNAPLYTDIEGQISTLPLEEVKNTIWHFSAGLDYAKLYRLNKFHISPGAQLNQISNNHGASELLMKVYPNAVLELTPDLNWKINPFINFQSNSTKKGSLLYNSVVGVRTSLEYTRDMYELEGILEANNVADGIWIDARAKFTLSPQNTYLVINGGKSYTQNSYSAFYRQNVHWKDMDTLRFTTFNYVDLGVHFSPYPLLKSGLHIGYRNSLNLPFFRFTTDEMYENYFELKYAKNTVRQLYFKAFGEFMLLKNNRVRLDFDYYGYDDDDLYLSKVTNLPQMHIKTSIHRRIQNKWDLGLDLSYMDGRIDYIRDVRKNLEGILNMNLSADYNVTNQWTAWADLINVLNTKADFLYNTPLAGRSLRIGMQYKF